MTQWEEHAACKGRTELFFRPGGVTKQAKRLCARCPVIDQCRTLALQLQAAGDLYGYWAGMTRAERVAITGRNYGAWWDNDE